MNSYIVIFVIVGEIEAFSSPRGTGRGGGGRSLVYWGTAAHGRDCETGLEVQASRSTMVLHALLRSLDFIHMRNWEQVKDFKRRSIVIRFVPLKHGIFGVPLRKKSSTKRNHQGTIKD